jgi:methyl coenzyme M reductase subunit D
MFGLDGKEGGDSLEGFLKKMGGDDIVIRTMVNDQRLSKLAEYEATKGYTNMAIDPDVVRVKFQEFKDIVRQGQISLRGLEDDVYERWGVNEASRENFTDGSETSCARIGFHSFDVEVAEIPEGSEQDH